MKFAICDDEKICFENLQSIIAHLGYSDKIQLDYYATGEELVSCLNANRHVDLLFLDIYFSEEAQGIKIAQEIRKSNARLPICFLTTSDEYVFDGYDVQAIHYLIKPIDEKQVLKIIHRMEEQAKNAYFAITSNYEVHRVFKRNILYIESNKRQLIIHLNDGSELTTYAKLQAFAAENLGTNFVQCHQSFIVNMAYIDEISANQLYLSHGCEIVPTSRKFKKSVLVNFKRYLFEER